MLQQGDVGPARPAADGKRWWALAALALSVLVVGLDVFVLTLAIPTLSVSLHASTGDTQWFLDAYSLLLAAALLPAGLLGDRYGRKRLLICALVLFGIASLACAYSTSTGELIAARATLGLAAAMIIPMSLAGLPVMFTEEERPRAIAAVGGATFLGYPLGPILGGWLLDRFWWGSVFLINVPIVVIAVAAVVFLMPESRSTQRPQIDLAGVLISSAALTAVTYGFIAAGTHGWTSSVALSTILGGGAAIVAFVGWEWRVTRRGGQPLVDLGLFRSAGFTWGTSLTTLIAFAMFGVFYVMPQYFLDVRGLDSLASGVRMLSLIGGLLIGVTGGQRLQTARERKDGAAPRPVAGPRAVGAAGFAIMAMAMVMGAGTGVATGTGLLMTWFAIAGFGLGLSMPTMLNAALGVLTPERSGSGSALLSAMRQVGATIGVAVLGTVIATVYQNHLHLPGLPGAAVTAARSSVAAGVSIALHAPGAVSAPLLSAVRHSYTAGVDVMLWICAGIAITSAVLAALFLPGKAAAAPVAGPAADMAGVGPDTYPADVAGGQ